MFSPYSIFFLLRLPATLVLSQVSALSLPPLFLSALSFSSSLCDSDCRWHPSSSSLREQHTHTDMHTHTGTQRRARKHTHTRTHSSPASAPLASLRTHISLIFCEAKCDTHTHTHARACKCVRRQHEGSAGSLWETDARCLSSIGSFFFFFLFLLSLCVAADLSLRYHSLSFSSHRTRRETGVYSTESLGSHRSARF